MALLHQSGSCKFFATAQTPAPVATKRTAKKAAAKKAAPKRKAAAKKAKK